MSTGRRAVAVRAHGTGIVAYAGAVFKQLAWAYPQSDCFSDHSPMASGRAVDRGERGQPQRIKLRSSVPGFHSAGVVHRHANLSIFGENISIEVGADVETKLPQRVNYLFDIAGLDVVSIRDQERECVL